MMLGLAAIHHAGMQLMPDWRQSASICCDKPAPTCAWVVGALLLAGTCLWMPDLTSSLNPLALHFGIVTWLECLLECTRM